ncbi:MAG TPA: tRNA (adenosine(37)-N6)-threonylcarbamoyltransferase complex ATPase subunit type 1 TsaE [Gemmatimonadaceae bacterium]|jgi:tRNA threonylcarbamoyladenosine biosynthesis protein TsaE
MPAADFTLPEMARWGEALGAGLEAPCVVTLAGDLGAGKTTLAQAICRGYGVHEAVTSPTFALVHEYAAPRSPVFHVDLYRLSGPQQLANIGWDDTVSARALVLIEWPERAGNELPAAAESITLSHVAEHPGLRRVSW